MNTTQPTAEAHRPAPYQPTIRDTILLEIPLDIRVSPSGHRAALLVRTTDWLDNRYRVDCRVHDVTAGATYRLTHTGDVLQAEWIDDRTLALLRPGADGRAQIGALQEVLRHREREIADALAEIEALRAMLSTTAGALAELHAEGPLRALARTLRGKPDATRS